MKVRVINDTSGWTKVIEVDDHLVSIYMSIRMPFVDYVHGGFGEATYTYSGEQDTVGRPIFRTRES